MMIMRTALRDAPPCYARGGSYAMSCHERHAACAVDMLRDEDDCFAYVILMRFTRARTRHVYDMPRKEACRRRIMFAVASMRYAASLLRSDMVICCRYVERA